MTLTERNHRLAWWCLFIAMAAGSVTTGCNRDPKGEGASRGAAAARQLAPLVLRDDTKDLLVTWIDSAGDFHVVQNLAEVPEDAKEKVRVVVTTQDQGSTDPVYVADLREKSSDQSYPVSTMPRAAWEELGATKRKARLESLAPVASAEPTSSSNAPASVPSKSVTIYGAKWCGACRQAKQYLAKKGVPFLEKDVDESPTVQAELRAKLTKSGMPPTSSIPILDIGGKLIVGFSQGAIDAALQGMKQ